MTGKIKSFFKALTYWIDKADKHKYSLSFFVIFSITLFVLFSHKKMDWIHDAGAYYVLHESFYDAQHNFSILNFNAGLRGYSFPLVLNGLRIIAMFFNIPVYPVFLAFMSLLFSLVSCLAFPRLIEKLFPGHKVKWIQIVVMALLFFSFWSTTMLYTLTDIPAILFLLLGMSWLLSNRFLFVALSGFAFGLAMNFRPIYMCSLIPVVTYLWFCKPGIDLLKRSLFTLCLLAGIAVVLLPQSLNNNRVLKTYSPLVQTTNAEGQSLYLQQLHWGLDFEKYETNIGEEYPVAPVRFISKSGVAIHSIEMERGALNNYSDFIGLLWKYPVEMTCIYLKHVFNSIDIHDTSVYSRNIYERRYFLTFLNYTCLFLFFSILMYEGLKKKKVVLWLSVTLILPFILVIPTAVEVRFSMPFLVIMYLTLGYYSRYASLFTEHFGRNKIKSVGAWLLFVTMCFLLSQSTYAGLEFYK